MQLVKRSYCQNVVWGAQNALHQLPNIHALSLRVDCCAKVNRNFTANFACRDVPRLRRSRPFNLYLCVINTSFNFTGTNSTREEDHSLVSQNLCSRTYFNLRVTWIHIDRLHAHCRFNLKASSNEKQRIFKIILVKSRKKFYYRIWNIL